MKYILFFVIFILSCRNIDTSTTAPEVPEIVEQESDKKFEVEDFGGGGNCFFLSLAGVLNNLFKTNNWTQEKVRKFMADYIEDPKRTVAEKNAWLEIVKTNLFDPVRKKFYKGVDPNNIKSLAKRIKNAPPFNNSIYQGDELAIQIAEQAFNITLLIIDTIDEPASANLGKFKSIIRDKKYKKYLAFIRQIGGDSSGHYQVHVYIGDGKERRLAFDLSDKASIPRPVQDLIDQQSYQAGIDFYFNKICRLKPNTCNIYKTEEDCKNKLLDNISICSSTAARPAQCRASGICLSITDDCDKFKDDKNLIICKKSKPGSEFLCVEDEGEKGCFLGKDEASCNSIKINGLAGFCEYILPIKSSCQIKAGVNPCLDKNPCDGDCELR
jgi:hypothetical protein